MNISLLKNTMTKIDSDHDMQPAYTLIDYKYTPVADNLRL